MTDQEPETSAELRAQMRDEIAALRTENAALKQALAPFKQIADQNDAWKSGRQRPNTESIFVAPGHLRRARDAILAADPIHPLREKSEHGTR